MLVHTDGLRQPVADAHTSGSWLLPTYMTARGGRCREVLASGLKGVRCGGRGDGLEGQTDMTEPKCHRSTQEKGTVQREATRLGNSLASPQAIGPCALGPSSETLATAVCLPAMGYPVSLQVRFGMKD